MSRGGADGKAGRSALREGGPAEVPLPLRHQAQQDQQVRQQVSIPAVSTSQYCWCVNKSVFLVCQQVSVPAVSTSQYSWCVNKSVFLLCQQVSVPGVSTSQYSWCVNKSVFLMCVNKSIFNVRRCARPFSLIDSCERELNPGVGVLLYTYRIPCSNKIAFCSCFLFVYLFPFWGFVCASSDFFQRRWHSPSPNIKFSSAVTLLPLM